jgi:hypothetical protein
MYSYDPAIIIHIAGPPLSYIQGAATPVSAVSDQAYPLLNPALPTHNSLPDPKHPKPEHWR